MASEVNNRISLKIDLAAGTIEIDAPADEFRSTVDKAKELLGQMPSTAPASEPPVARQDGDSSARPSVSGANSHDRPKSRASRAAGGSQGRPGRIGSFEPIDLGLSEAQERDLRAFMEAKAPKEQPDQVAVALYKGEQLLGRKGLSYNEIYSLMRLSGIRELPKALDVTIGRMMDGQLVVREGPQQFSLKFVGRDYVEHKLGIKE